MRPQELRNGFKSLDVASEANIQLNMKKVAAGAMMWLQKQDGASGVKSKDKWFFGATLLSILFCWNSFIFLTPGDDVKVGLFPK